MAGRLDAEQPAYIQQRLDRLALARPKGFEAESIF
jgi:hypothetical protein